VIAPQSPGATGGIGWISASTPLVLFVTLGLPAGALGVAWPHMRASLDAPLAGLGLLLAAHTAAYFVASASTGPLGTRLGTPVLLVGGCGLAAIGSLGLSLASTWWMVPAVSLLLGGGSGLIDAAANAHTSLNRGVRFMGWLHASWALGATLGPAVVVISLGATGSWRASFAAMAVVFLAIGLIVASRRRDWVNRSGAVDRRLPATRPVPADYRRALALLIGLLFVAAGLEATAGDWSYTQLTAGRSLSGGLASLGASLFWAGLAGGRVALGLLGNRAAPVRLLDISIGVATLAALTYWLAPPLVSALIALPILGAAVSVIFPVLLSITPTRVGAAMTSHAVGYELAAGTLGGGGLPALTGLVLQSAGLRSLGPLLFVMAVALTLLHVSSRVGGGRRSLRHARDPRAT
jgi:fucose permease